VSEDHVFTVPVPENVPPDGRMCLTIKGTQVPSMPGPPVTRFEGICQVIWFQRVAVQTGISWEGLAGNDQLPAKVQAAIPNWLETQVTVPLWRRDPPDDDTLESAMTAHVSVVDRPDPADVGSAGANTIVHFAAAGTERPLELLAGVLARRRRREAAVSVTLVLPRGAFKERRTELERRIGSLGQDVARLLAVTEDYEGGWSRAFGLERPPATYLMNTEGTLVWQEVGPLDAASLARALDEHLVAGPPARSRPLRQTVRPGRRAPDVHFEYVAGERIALRKLHGQRVLLLFWQSWSAPCVAELRRLQALHERGGEEPLAILAIDDGEEPGVAARVRAELGLTYAVVADPHRRIARTYGVRCWPTTVLINGKGVVERVHLGVAHEPKFRELEPDR
jgi:peroxiredoxin